MRVKFLLPVILFLGGLSFAALGLVILWGVQQPQNILPSFAKASDSASTHFSCVDVGSNKGSKKLNDNDSKIKYSKWAYKSGGGGSSSLYQNDYHFAPNPLGDGTQNLKASATLDFTGNQVTIGWIGWINRGYMKVFIDDKFVDEFDTSTGQVKTGTWTSPILSCGDHTLKITQSDKKGKTNGGRVIALDFVSYRQCTKTGGNACALVAGEGDNENGCTTTGPCPADGNKHVVCTADKTCALSDTATEDDPGCSLPQVGQGCNFTPKKYLQCKNYACVEVEGVTADDAGCLNKKSGDVCGKEMENACQGSGTIPAKCFDCKIDATPSSQINILDFSCFAKYFEVNVGK